MITTQKTSVHETVRTANRRGRFVTKLIRRNETRKNPEFPNVNTSRRQKRHTLPRNVERWQNHVYPRTSHYSVEVATKHCGDRRINGGGNIATKLISFRFFIRSIQAIRKRDSRIWNSAKTRRPQSSVWKSRRE